MAEKYTLLMHETAMHWAEGCPVMLATHAIARNNVTGSIFAQLKFQSFAERCIKAVSVSVAGYDTYGQPCTDTLKYTYTDLVISNRAFFGTQTALPLSPATCRYTVTVDEVFFENGEVWQNAASTPMQPLELPEQKSINTLGASASLYRQELAQLQPRNAHHILPAAGNGIKLCGCGALMLLRETVCPYCGIQYGDLETLVQLDLLQKQREELARREEELRLAEERARAEEQQLAEKQLPAEVAQHTALEPQQETEQKSAQLNNQQAVGIKAKKNGSKKGVKRLLVVLAVLLIAAVGAAVYFSVIVPKKQQEQKYSQALLLFQAKEYTDAATLFAEFEDYEEASLYLQYCNAELLIEEGKTAEAAIAFGNLIGFEDARERSFSLWKDIAPYTLYDATETGIVAITDTGEGFYAGIDGYLYSIDSLKNIVSVSLGAFHIVGLRSDGSVVASGDNSRGQCNVEQWQDIVAVSAGGYYTVGLKADGTVVATGDNVLGQCDVEDWSDIVALAVSLSHTVGLKADGTVVATGNNNYGQCDVENWSDIVALDVSLFEHTVGLRADGTVVAVGNDDFGQCSNTKDWCDIIAISAYDSITAGLKADGTVVAVGNPIWNACEVENFKDIVSIDASFDHIVGVKANGTVVTSGDNPGYARFWEPENWTDIAVAFNFRGGIIGIKTNGTMVVADGIEELPVYYNLDEYVFMLPQRYE